MTNSVAGRLRGAINQYGIAAFAAVAYLVAGVAITVALRFSEGQAAFFLVYWLMQAPLLMLAYVWLMRRRSSRTVQTS